MADFTDPSSPVYIIFIASDIMHCNGKANKYNKHDGVKYRFGYHYSFFRASFLFGVPFIKINFSKNIEKWIHHPSSIIHHPSSTGNVVLVFHVVDSR